MALLYALILLSGLVMVAWVMLGTDDTEYDNAVREPVFVPVQRPGGDR